MKKALLAVALVALNFSPDTSQAQNTSQAQLAPGNKKERCGSSFNIEQLKQYEPAAYQKWLSIEKHTQEYIKGRQTLSGAAVGPSPQRVSSPSVTVTIPVVVHVVYNATAENISDAQIQSQIDVLNEDYRRLNADASQTPSQFAGVASDFNIVFKLACVDPNGNSTNGIVRANTSTTGFSYVGINPTTPNETAIGVKFVNGAAAWPSNTYLNIWTCNFVDGTLGYGRFPGTAASNVDGVVVAYNAMGRVGTLQPKYNKGRTATHEIGHWLNLIHVWGDSNCGDDLCADTPTQQTSNYGCVAFPHRTCSNNGDMSMNYMDYSDDACMNLFTSNQKDRARANFAAGGFRESFISTKIQEQVNQVCSGPVTFSVAANQGAAVAYNWTVTGALQLASGQGSNQITCNQNGTGTATITVSANGYCDSKTVQVGAPPLTGTYYENGYNTLTGFNYVTTGTVTMYMQPAANTTYSFATQFPTTTVYQNTPGSNTAYFYVGPGNGNNNRVQINVTASGAGVCGTTTTASYQFYVPQTQAIAASPNPATSELLVQAIPPAGAPQFSTPIPPPPGQSALAAPTDMPFEVQLYNSYGQLVKTGKSQQGKLKLSVLDLPNGLYTLRSGNGKETTSEQIQIAH